MSSARETCPVGGNGGGGRNFDNDLDDEVPF